MSFFSSIGKALKDVGNKVIKPIVKDAVPIAAAVATGGTSLAVLKPTNVMERLDKATGLPVSALAGGGQPQMPIEQSSAVVNQTSVTPPIAPQNNQSIYDQITPYLQNLLGNSRVQSSPREVQTVEQNSNSGSKSIFYILGGGVALLLVFLLIKRKK